MVHNFKTARDRRLNSITNENTTKFFIHFWIKKNRSVTQEFEKFWQILEIWDGSALYYTYFFVIYILEIKFKF